MRFRLFLCTVLIMAVSSGIYAAGKKVGVVVTIQPVGMAIVTSNGKVKQVKPYMEIAAGDIIEIKKAGKVEIILSNFEKVILKNPRKIKINDDFSIVDVEKNQKATDSKKKDKFSDDIARDMSADNSFTMGASRGGDSVSDKVKEEIAEAGKIDDLFLRHTAMYHIYRKYNYRTEMAKEAKILSDLQKGK